MTDHPRMKGTSSPGASALARLLLATASLCMLLVPPCGAFSGPPRGTGRPALHHPRSSSSPGAVSAAAAGGHGRRRTRGPLAASLRELAGGDPGGDGGGDGGPSEQSRSRYGSDTGFRTRDPFGTGADGGGGGRGRRRLGGDAEGGLNADRVSSFSFATGGLRSGSQGTLSGAEDLDEMGAGDGETPLSGTASQGQASKADAADDAESADDKGEDAGSRSKGGPPGMAADDLHGNVSIHYSKRKYPEPKEVVDTDESDEGGLHADRLGTFSFSSEGAPSRTSTTAQRPPPSADASRGDEDFAADNFRNSVEVFGSRAPSSPAARRTVPGEGQSDQSARLSTFSFARDEGDGRDPPSQPRGAGRAGLGGLLSDEGARGGRLGTFSFASSETRSGSTGTSPSGSPPDAGGSAAGTTGGRRPERSEAESKLPSPSRGSFDPHGIYTASGSGGLSGLASGVETVSRVDRIREMQERTDPRRLHPDGMNVPRLNMKGEVMSLGRSGRPNIFDRIEEAGEGGGGGGGAQAPTSAGARASEAGVESSGRGDTRGASKSDNVGFTTDGATDEPNKEGDGGADADKDGAPDARLGDCFVGFDLGTSGARMSVVERTPPSSPGEPAGHTEVFAESLRWDGASLRHDDPDHWRRAVDVLLGRCRGQILARVRSVCVSGTSASCVLVDRDGMTEATRPARMYNYDITKSGGDDTAAADRVARLMDRHVPPNHTARAATSSLSKLLLWNEERSVLDEDGNVREVLCHQSDYVSMCLMNEGLEPGRRTAAATTSDWHNCLKLGYDVRERRYPDWMSELLGHAVGPRGEDGAPSDGGDAPADPMSVLPSRVVSPGEPFGVLSNAVATRHGMSSNVVLVGGTTDSNAAFLAAAGARPEYGTAVTSLGSTLAIKMLSRTFVEDASRGVYSHRFPRFGGSGEGDGEEEAWLIGGASNVGCAVLRQENFSDDELASLSAGIDPDVPSPLSYYPLPGVGERFPVADSSRAPVLEPRPEGRGEYLHGILQGISDVERDGYRALGDLGSDPARPAVVLSCGGGARNDMWLRMRERRLGVLYGDGDRGGEVRRADNTEASYGAALLAAASFE